MHVTANFNKNTTKNLITKLEWLPGGSRANGFRIARRTPCNVVKGTKRLTGEVIRLNNKTAIIQLPDGNFVKRHAKKHCCVITN